jgi:hypothetical protein
MGDRAVIGFKANKDATPVYLYMHWGGSDRYLYVRDVIKAAQPRWNDAAYSTRIAISQIIEYYWKEETGFGISAGENSFCQPDYDDIPVVLWDEQQVIVVSATDSTQPMKKYLPGPISFNDFLRVTGF